MSGNIKGALTHLPTVMGWNRRQQSGGQDSEGCGGCLVILIIVWLVTLIIQYWIPIVSVIGAVLLVVIVVKLVIFARARRGSTQSAKHEVTAPAVLVQDKLWPPAEWYPDPLGDHHYRYWDGSRWSGLVADNGEVTSHPL
ncbi:MAG: DUF2510 domain-containing protein [Coriobacteriia bacterium]|nr:DUF2510 domain-containing protein [Coriobacteriia bacterium]